MDSSSQHLYPVVHDLTNAEYSRGFYRDGTLGSFTLQDLALPTITPHAFQSNALWKNMQNSRRRRHQIIFKACPENMKENAILLEHTSSACSNKTENTLDTTGSSIDEKIDLENASFDALFVLTQQVSRCRFSTTWECVHRFHGTRHCAKVIDKRRFQTRSDHLTALREICIFPSLQRKESCRRIAPNLIQVTEDEDYFHIVMEHMEGGSLDKMIQKRHHLSESNARTLAYSILQGLQELHRLSIGHFCIQPDNILLDASFSTACLCDFGYAMNLESKRESWQEHRGYERIHYAAPELIGSQKQFGLAADVWSCGVVLYQMLCGRLPFMDASRHALKDKICMGKFRFEGPEWHRISRGAKQFVSALLHTDPQVRLTAAEALSHHWISRSLPDASKDSGGVLSLSSSQNKSSTRKREDRDLHPGQRLWARFGGPARKSKSFSKKNKKSLTT